jgi:hypothetical protein
LSKRQYKNFVTLDKEIFEKKNNKVGKNKFYNEQKQDVDGRMKSLIHYRLRKLFHALEVFK